MNWNTCLRQKEAKLIKPDLEMAASLEKTSANKTFSSQLLELTEKTVASKISLDYDSVRELLEVIALRRGFKIYNHICYTGFLKEIMNETELAEEFDELRIIRNDINYYGKEVSIIEAKEVLKRLHNLRIKLLKITSIS
ncbi:MAG TPA: hypothetical protein VJB13_04160 [Candidatus Nanoarchaeia archaeon]|nr:hypothetical protein [Candidatus Nanoarchaeia archaeon]